jgi:hypothetical protein
MLVASVGAATAVELELIPKTFADEPKAGRLSFGSLEPLAGMMQETPADKQLPILIEKLKSGTTLHELVAAGALANARQFGGQDYVGWHTFMALAPAFEMSKELPAERQALPVLKVLYRNAQTMQRTGGPKNEVLKPVAARSPSDGRSASQALRDAVWDKDTAAAESTLAALASSNPDDAFEALQPIVDDSIFPDADGVHCSVLAWRALATLDLTGKEHAATLLRQSLRYCLNVERRTANGVSPSIRNVLPRLIDRYKLATRPAGTRQPDDAWVEKFAQTLGSSNRDQAADAVAAALADGIAPDAVGQAIALAANALLLADTGRPSPTGTAGTQFMKGEKSVHGDSAGVHASDAVNAWRNIARVSNPRNAAASLIVATYVANAGVGNNSRVGKDLYPLADHLEGVKSKDPATLVREVEEAIRANDQIRVCAAVHRYGQLDQSPRPILDVLLKYAVSEDGALHAEKYYKTATEEFSAMRPAFRWRQLVALARVTASEYGQPAPGYGEACELLKV